MSYIARIALVASTLIFGTACADGAPTAAGTLKPVKVAAPDAAGPIFRSKSAVKSATGPDGHTTDVSMLKSRDGRFEAGIFEAGPSDQSIESYEEDEFMYFLEGGVRLTSADGTVLEARAGDAVAIPKGWKGRWTTKGYRKYYVTYAGVPPSK